MGEIKTILVTGSSSGIGLGVARRFAAAGYNVALNSFEPESRVADVIDGVAAAGAGRAAYF